MAADNHAIEKVGELISMRISRFGHWKELDLDPRTSGDLDGPVMKFPFDGGVGADGHCAGANMALNGAANDGLMGLQSAKNRGTFENLHGSSSDLAINPAADRDVALRGQATGDGKPRL